MYQGGIVRAHGGQGAVAGHIGTMPPIEAVFRGISRTIKVWQGHGEPEEFSLREAEALCVAGDAALMDRDGECQLRGYAALYAGPNDDGEIRPLIVPRIWLIAFLAALRRGLRTAETAQALAPKRAPTCIDDQSDPGSWGRHLRHTAPMRGASGGDSS